jgi:hypothetical protein
MSDAEAIADGLTKAHALVVVQLPVPRAANAPRMIAARGYGDLWRKASNRYDDMIRLEDMGVVERRVSRSETLWRLTRPLGLRVRDVLLARENGGE